MKATVERYRVGGFDRLWHGNLDIAPREGDFVCLDPDSASFVVHRVDWDYSSTPTMIIWVK